MDAPPLMKKLTRMFDNQEHCDITFEVQGKTLQAHRLILIAQEFPLVDTKDPAAALEVEEVDFDTFQSIIRYFYTDKIKVHRNNVFKLSHAASCLKIPGLADLCTSYLTKTASLENFVLMMNMALDFQILSLQNYLTNFFIRNFKVIINRPDFALLSTESVGKLLLLWPDFLQSADFALESFVMLKRWARAECQRQGKGIATGLDLQNAFGEHLRKLPVPFMRTEDIGRLVIGQDILSKEEELSLLHFISLPSHMRQTHVSANFPFDSKPLFLPKSSTDTLFCKVYGKCGECTKDLDGNYGAEMIHCKACNLDMCMKCQEKHDGHRKNLTVKTALADPEKSCGTCGWPTDAPAKCLCNKDLLGTSIKSGEEKIPETLSFYGKTKDTRSKEEASAKAVKDLAAAVANFKFTQPGHSNPDKPSVNANPKADLLGNPKKGRRVLQCTRKLKR